MFNLINFVLHWTFFKFDFDPKIAYKALWYVWSFNDNISILTLLSRRLSSFYISNEFKWSLGQDGKSLIIFKQALKFGDSTIESCNPLWKYEKLVCQFLYIICETISRLKGHYMWHHSPFLGQKVKYLFYFCKILEGKKEDVGIQLDYWNFCVGSK